MKADLHAQIMNLQGSPGMYSLDDTPRVAYAEGHRDARHAAAELALHADVVRDELLAALKMARRELDNLPRSLGYSFTHLPQIDAAIKHATGEDA